MFVEDLSDVYTSPPEDSGALSDPVAVREGADVEALAAPAGAITPDSARRGHERQRVRRSKALEATIATDPSPAIEPSAPPSTGDTSLPSASDRRQPSVRELVLGVLSERDRQALLTGGTPRHEASSSSGPLRPQVLLRLREVLVRQYTPAAWRSHVAWHAYWTEHAYDTLNDELRVASPPRPRSDHRTIRLTWGEVRKWVREEGATLDESSLEAWRDVSRPPGARTLADDRDTSRERSASSSTRHVASVDEPARRTCQRPGCDQRIPPDSRPEAMYCSKSCRQKVSRARIKERPPAPASVAAHSCGWCEQPMPPGLRPEATFCSKRCRQASSRFGLGVKRATVLPEALEVAGPGDASPDTTAPAVATRRGSSRARSRRDVSPVDQAPPGSATRRGLRLAYADPPYPGKAGLYPEDQEVDHRALVARLVTEFPNGWALSTSASALRSVLALCPADVRVCSWHRQIRRTRSRRPLSAWEPLIVHGGRELPTNVTQTATDALAYAGRYRTFPGAMTGMKPPQFAVWMFAQLGALPGDELVDLFPGSGAVSRAWERYTQQPGDSDVSPGSAPRPARSRGARRPAGTTRRAGGVVI
jgi:hypothetical protein